MKLVIGILIGLSLSSIVAIASDSDYWRGRQTSEEYNNYQSANESSVYSNRPPSFKNVTPSIKNPC